MPKKAPSPFRSDCHACVAVDALAYIERVRDTREGWTYEVLGYMGATMEKLATKPHALCSAHRKAQKERAASDAVKLSEDMAREQREWEKRNPL